MPAYRRWKQCGGISVSDLPGAIWVPNNGAVTLADGDTTVDDWTAQYGSLPFTTHLLDAPAATNRPAWLAGAGVDGRNRIRFDGVDNVLVVALTKGSAWDQLEWGFAGELNADGATGDRALGYGPLAAGPRLDESSTANTLRTSSGSGGVAVNFTTTALATAHYSMDWQTGSQNGRINGTISGTGAPAALSRADGQLFAVGAFSDGTIASNLDIDAVYIMYRVLTVLERARLRAWLTAHVGYAC